MPRGDGTGPMGFGPRTGRVRGFCAGYSLPGYMNPGFGYGFGRLRGRGFGRGFGWWRWRFVPVESIQPERAWEPIQIPQGYQPTKEQEMQMLENERKAIEEEQKALEQELKEIGKRIEELKKKK